MGSWGERIAVGALVTVLGAACSGSDSPTSPAAEQVNESPAEDAAPAVVAEEFTGADFYAAPDPLPEAEHGTLLRYEPVDAGLENGTVWRVMYLSESLEGEPIAVTGLIAVPGATAPAEGWKLLSLAHGTSGVADECAPSQQSGGAELLLARGAIEAGYVVAMTDYEGMGTPGVHPYLVGPSEARGVLDAARAARQLPDVLVGERFAVFGYSQGGHGAAWANELAAEWVPELELVGSVAGAPPSEMNLIFQALGSSDLSPDFFYFMVAGYQDAYPDADPADILNADGLAVLESVDSGCFDTRQAMNGKAITDLVRGDFGEAEAWTDRLAENDPGQVAVESPLLILHSAADPTVPAGLSEQMFTRMCEVGQVVERRVYDRGQNHIEAAPDAAIDGFAWIQERMAGSPATSNCP